MPFLGTGWWPLQVTGGEKVKTLPLLSQYRDTLLNAEKFYINFQQERKTFKACFYLKSICAKTLASLTDILLSFWGLQRNSFSCFKCCLGFERKLIYFILIYDQRDIILQVKRTLCWHTCYAVLSSSAPCRLSAFKPRGSVVLPDPTSQLSHTTFFKAELKSTAIQAHCFFPLLNTTIYHFCPWSHLSLF